MSRRNEFPLGEPLSKPPDKNHKSRPVVGVRMIRLIDDLLAGLHDAGAHGNRVLHLDHIVVAHLIAFFNPTVDSLRTIEDAFDRPRIQQRFGVPRITRSTLSDAQRVFDPKLLQPLVDALAQRVRRKPGGDARLDGITRQITAVDATCFEVAARILWARPRNSEDARGTVQMCLHFDVVHGVPRGFTLIDGQSSERAELPAAVLPDRLYLLDRAYQSYEHLNTIVERGSDFVVRLRRSARFTTTCDRPLTTADHLAGVIQDSEVTPADRKQRFSMPARLVEIAGLDGRETVRLLTNRLDLSAEQIGLLYRNRWQIELFFRWLKCIVGLLHFTSESPDGITLQLYTALIGTLLLALYTGNRPNKYDYSLMSMAISGFLTPAEVLEVSARRRAERQRAAERYARRCKKINR